jgi:hypothetical protein
MLPYDGAIVRAVAHDLAAQSAKDPLVFLEKFLAMLDSGRYTSIGAQSGGPQPLRTNEIRAVLARWDYRRLAR